MKIEVIYYKEKEVAQAGKETFKYGEVYFLSENGDIVYLTTSAGKGLKTGDIIDIGIMRDKTGKAVLKLITKK